MSELRPLFVPQPKLDPAPHAYGCVCDQCRSMAAAIAAMEGDEYFFTDAELLAIAQSHSARCSCELCADMEGR